MTSVLKNCTYFVSNRLARDTEKIAKKIYEPTGMNPTYGYVLMAIDEQKTVLLHELADQMGYQPSTMSRFVDTLVKKGVIKKQYDWRKVTLSLTESGKAMVKISHACLAKMDEATCQLFGSAEQRNVVVNSLNDWTKTIEKQIK